MRILSASAVTLALLVQPAAAKSISGHQTKHVKTGETKGYDVNVKDCDVVTLHARNRTGQQIQCTMWHWLDDNTRSEDPQQTDFDTTCDFQVRAPSQSKIHRVNLEIYASSYRSPEDDNVIDVDLDASGCAD